MAELQKATFRVEWGNGDVEMFDVQYNPTELSFDKRPIIGEVSVNGSESTQKQHLHGGDETLSMELFFDSTEDGMGAGATSVTEMSDRVYQLTKADSETHKQPIVTFAWGSNFPGDALAVFLGAQRRNTFTGIVESVSQKFTLFSPAGVPLRAKVNLTLKEYIRLDEQFLQKKNSSPDKTHVHVVQDADRLSAISQRYYRRTSEWRAIADHNDIEDPRRITSGAVLDIPPIR